MSWPQNSNVKCNFWQYEVGGLKKGCKVYVSSELPHLVSILLSPHLMLVTDTHLLSHANNSPEALAHEHYP